VQITLHTYAQMWIHPYSHEYQFYPPDVQKLKSLALRATARLKEIYGTSYRVGTGADLLGLWQLNLFIPICSFALFSTRIRRIR
jgi:hypothetical protein